MTSNITTVSSLQACKTHEIYLQCDLLFIYFTLFVFYKLNITYYSQSNPIMKECPILYDISKQKPV